MHWPSCGSHIVRGMRGAGRWQLLSTLSYVTLVPDARLHPSLRSSPSRLIRLFAKRLQKACSFRPMDFFPAPVSPSMRRFWFGIPEKTAGQENSKLERRKPLSTTPGTGNSCQTRSKTCKRPVQAEGKQSKCLTSEIGFDPIPCEYRVQNVRSLC